MFFISKVIDKVKSFFDAYLLLGGLDMSNIFFSGEKAKKQVAINEMLIHISNYFNGRYEVIATSDDGGNHLEVQVEMDNVSDTIESQHVDFPFYEIWPMWMGWRTLVVKVPSGYIDAITNGTELDDY